MLRSFLPVGQGAFYLEQFKSNDERINVIYDCGSLTDVKLVEREIRTNFSEGETIEIVFISHLDQDHINGLEYLLKYCNVRNIVFPYTAKRDRITLAIDYLCNGSNPSEKDFIYGFILDPYRALQENYSQTRLYVIDEDRNNDRVMNDESENFEMISSGVNILECFLVSEIARKIHWEYVPFNFKNDKRQKQFLEELDNNLKKLHLSLYKIGIENILHMWTDPDIQNAIITAYKKVKGNLNTNSMVLFSGIRNDIQQWRIHSYNNYHYYCFYKCIKHFDCCFKKNGCLYTGDYEAKGKQKWDELKKAYSKYWDYIGCVQLPHHGSYKNYNQEFSLFNAYFVISAGYQNKYGHPSGSVIKDLLLNNKYPLIVTEQHNSEIIFNVDI